MRRLKFIFVLSLIAAVLCFTVACNDDSVTQNPNTDQNTSDPSDEGGSGGIIQDPDISDGDGSGETDYEEAPNSDGVLTFNLNADLGSYYVSGLSDAGATEISVPDTFNSKPVTAIGAGAFRSSRIKSVVIGAGVTEIKDRAFSLCYDLESVSFAEGSALAAIGEKAFYCCESLNDVTVPGGVVSLGAECFAGAWSLSDIEFSDNLTYVGENAMADTAWFANADPGIVYIGSVAYGYKHIPEVTKLTLIIDDGTTAVADGAFYGDEIIAEIRIPASVTHIGYKAFAACKNLTKITVDELNPAYYSSDNALVERATLTLIKGTDAVCEGVKAIGDYAFAFSLALTDVILPSSVETIGVSAFEGAENLASFVLNDTVSEIPDGAFRDDVSLLSVSVPKGIKQIAGTAFSGCTGLKTVYLNSPAVITEAKMSTSAGHILEHADKVFVGVTAFLDEEGQPLKDYDPKDAHPYVSAFFEMEEVSSADGYYEWTRKEVN